LSRVKNVIEFLRLARERYTWALQADGADRSDAQDDVRFCAGGENQWDKAALKSRKRAKRPILTWNKCGGFVQQVCNDQRQSKPSIKITPLDEGTPETAEFYQSRIRHIEYESDADVAYDTAMEQAVKCGRGAYKVTTRYKKKSHEQEILIKRIENQFSWLFDPGAREYDRSDADWCFVVSPITKDEHQRRFGKKRDVHLDWDASAQLAPEWVGIGGTGEMIMLAEYWLKEHNERTLCLMVDGSSQWKDELSPEQLASGIQLDDDQEPTERQEDDITVCQYVIDGVEILDQTEWLGTIFPVIPQWGHEEMVDGVVRTSSLIRPAKDPQRSINLYCSNIAEQIALMPKTPFIAAVGAIAGREQEWETANSDPKAVLQYKPD